MKKRKQRQKVKERNVRSTAWADWHARVEQRNGEEGQCRR